VVPTYWKLRTDAECWRTRLDVGRPAQDVQHATCCDAVGELRFRESTQSLRLLKLAALAECLVDLDRRAPCSRRFHAHVDLDWRALSLAVLPCARRLGLASSVARGASMRT
jgi:ribosomal protein S18 acetylase RimI-like enzyme